MKTNILISLMIVVCSSLFAQQGWQYQYPNLTNNQYGAIYAVNKDTVYVMADQGKFLKTVNGGTTWISKVTGLPEAFFDLSFSGSEVGYATGRNGMLIKTTDGGTTWFKLTSGTNLDLFSIAVNSPDNIWVVGDSGVILHSVDFGNTWLKYNSLTSKRLNNIGFKNSSVGFITGNSGTLFKTVNGGGSWETVTLGITEDLFSLTIADNYTYFLAGSIYGYMFSCNQYYMTHDNSTWTSNFIGTLLSPVSRMFFQNDSLGFCISSDCTTNGNCWISIAKTTDYGQFWVTSFNYWNPPSMAGIAYNDIVFVTDSIGYALSGDNILKTIDGGTFVGVKELNDHHLFKLFPNPSATGDLNIELTDINLTGISVEISDLNGLLLFKSINLKTMNHVDVSKFNNGVYAVKLFRDRKLIDVEKLIITKSNP